MAIPHAKPGDVIDIRGLGDHLSDHVTETLVKTPTLQVIRLILPAGKIIPEHHVDGEITVQCLEGLVAFTSRDMTQEIGAGHFLYLEGGDAHAVTAIEGSSLLVTIQTGG